jgi:hypothetical protein
MTLQDHDHLRHRIAGEFARESVAYCLLMPEHGLMGHWYTWVDERDQAGFAMVLHGEGPDPVFFDHQTGFGAAGLDFDDWRVGRVSLAVGEPLRTAHATYQGDEVGLDFTFEGLHDAFDYDSNATGTPAYLAQNRYEQGGRIVGTLTWRGQELRLDGPGHRDHSWGTRDWDAIHHYKWIAAAGEDVATNLMWTMAMGEVDVNGYMYRDGLLSPVTGMQIDTTYGADLVHDALRASVVDEAGRTTEVDLDQRHTLARWDVIPSFNFSDTLFTGTVAGQDVRAYVEYTWPRAYLDHVLKK